MLALRNLLWPATAALCCACGIAAAQVVSLPPSAALQCMTPPAAERGLPEYDADLVQRKDGGIVRVELAFAAPDQAPDVRVLEPETFRALTSSVLRYVQQLRVPCLPAGAEPVRIVQEFAFLPNDGRKVMASAPRDTSEREQRRQMACLTRIAGPDRPDYPREALRLRLQRNILLRLHFDSPTAPPRAEFVGPLPHSSFRAEVGEFARHYRLPCQRGAPVALDVTLHFKIEGHERTVLRDMPLLNFLRSAQTIPRPAYFDLDRLGCPFDVRVEYYQPFKANHVRELGSSDPARLAFLDWLSGISLNLPKDTALQVLGDRFTLTVPCGKVDL